MSNSAIAQRTDEGLRQLIDRCDFLMKKGQIKKAQESLADVNTRQVPDELRFAMGNLFLRAGLNRKGLLVLDPLIADRASADNESSDAETSALYALLLMRHGATHEALQRLASFEDAEVEQVHFSMAICQMTLWDHSSATSSLMKYLSFELDPYQSLLGRLNLFACMVMNPNPEPALVSLGQECISESKGNGYLRILGNALEIRAQYHLRQKNFAGAEADLNEAAGLLQRDPTQELFYVQKWQTILKGYQEKSALPLLELRKQAKKHQQWESLRSLDLHILKIEFDDRRFRHLYVGSPLPKFRESITLYLEREAPPLSYHYGNPTAQILDLTTGEMNGSIVLKPGQLTHKLLNLLISDFYRPRRIGEIFASLFPGEDFSAQTSFDRVQKVLARARKELLQKKIPLTTTEESEYYPLMLTAPIALEISEVGGLDSKEVLLWIKLCKAIGDRTKLDSTEIQSLLRLPKSSARRFIQFAVNKGSLSVHGKGKATRYQVHRN